LSHATPLFDQEKQPLIGAVFSSNPDVVCAVSVITPEASLLTVATYLVAGEQFAPPTHGTAMVDTVEFPTYGSLLV